MKTITRITFSLLIAYLALFLTSCKDEPETGSFELSVTFGSPKPTAPCWLNIEVRQIQENAPAQLVWKMSPVRYPLETAGVSTDVPETDNTQAPANGTLDLSGIPYGDDYVVVVILRDTAFDNGNLLYLGNSARFSLHEGSQNSLAVLLSTVAFSIPTEEVLGTSPSFIADLHLAVNRQMFSEFEKDTKLLVSNLPDFDPSSESLLDNLVTDSTGFTWENWDLNKDVCGTNSGNPVCMDGDRYVYIRVVSPIYNVNEIYFKRHTLVDTVAPFMVEPFPTLPERTNKTVVVEVSFSEPVIASSVQVDCDGLGFPNIDPLEGGLNDAGKSISAKVRITCPLEAGTPNRLHTITLTAQDQNGRSTGTVVLGQVTVDTEWPKINGQVTVSPESVSFGDVATIEFSLTEAVETLVVRLGEIDISDDCSADPFVGDRYICTVTATEKFAEGWYDVGIALKDYAENWANYDFLAFAQFDYHPPVVLESKVTPTFARAGMLVEVDVTFSEPPSEVELFPKDFPLASFVPVLNTPNRYRGTFVVAQTDLNKKYDLTISYKDGAGNEVNAVPLGQITIDTTLPYLTEKITADRAVARQGEQFTFSFTVSEPLTYVAVNVGLVALDVVNACSVSNSGRTYTCSHIPPNQEGEGQKGIAVAMMDEAGNYNLETEQDAIIYNYASPRVAQSTVTPRTVKIGDTVFITVNFSERVKNVTMDWDGLNGGTNPDPNTFESIFFFALKIEAGTPDKRYKLAVASGEDSLGDPLPYTVIQDLVVDSTPPTIVSNSFVVDKRPVKNGQTFGIHFTLSEPLTTMTLIIGDVPTSASYAYNCSANQQCVYYHKAIDDPETSGVKNVSVEMIDLAGNRAVVRFENAVEYDFSAPYMSALSGAFPKPAMDGDEMVLSLIFSEPVNINSLKIDTGDLDFGPLTDSGDSTEFYAYYDVTAADPQGTYTITVSHMEDLAGNVNDEPDTITAIIARTLYVATDGPENAKGLSWTDAYPTLKRAMDAAKPKQKIWVKRGTYRLDGGVQENRRTDTFKLTANVKIYGGFKGTETDESQRNFNDDNPYSVLDGRLLGGDLDNTPVYHVVTVNGAGYLDGFAITNGDAAGSLPHTVGGGVLLEKGSLTLANCEIGNNRAAGSGGGIYSYMSTLKLSNTTVKDNTASMEGGGVYCTDSNVQILKSRFEGNTSDQDGGALLLNGGQGTVVHNSEFFDNQSQLGYGGAVKDRNTSLEVANSVFVDNQSLFGAGISHQGRVPFTVNYSTFFDNLAETAGNALYLEDNLADNIYIYGSIFWSTAPSCQVESNAVTNNIIVRTSNLPTCSTASTVQCDANCISPANPLFEDSDTSDDVYSLRLLPGSTSINAGNCDLRPLDILDIDGNGNTMELIPYDIDGALRCNQEPDLGAYEFH